MSNAAGGSDPLAEARSRIEQQAQEIADLQRRIEADTFAEELRQALILGSTVSTLTMAVSHAQLLEMVVDTAVHVISATAGSLLLVDHQARELVFEISVGGKARELRKMRMPLGHGVVGLVAASGQAMAVADAHDDPRVARDIVDRIGYMPDSLLAVPLFYDRRVIGVFELVDKRGAPYFTTADMGMLALFANQAAVAIEYSRARDTLVSLMSEVVTSGQAPATAADPAFQGRAAAFAQDLEQRDPTYRGTLQLADTIRRIAGQGERERKLALAVLTAVEEYAQASRPSTGRLGPIR